jgi:hypothetical protein
VAYCRRAISEDMLPMIRLNDLRHINATILSPRESRCTSCPIGSATPNAVATMTVYAHRLTGSQRDATDLFARLIGETGA